MEIKHAICTICGSPLKLDNPQAHMVTCKYCKNTIVVENAIDLSKVEIDHSKTIKSLRELLVKSVKINDVRMTKEHAQKLLEIIPHDYLATYYFAYAQNKLGNHNYLKSFYQRKADRTTTIEIEEILNHSIEHSDLRDRSSILGYINSLEMIDVSGYLRSYEKQFNLRKKQEENYDDIPRDVFICHRSVDIDIAEEIVRTLEKDGYQCWISTKNLRPNDSENYWDSIERAINHTKIFLVVSSEEAMLSNDVKKEMAIGKNSDKPRIEFKIDNSIHTTYFKVFFDGLKWIDYHKLKHESFEVLKHRVFELIDNKAKPPLKSVTKEEVTLVSLKKSAESALSKNNYKIALSDINQGLNISPTDANLLYFKLLASYQTQDLYELSKTKDIKDSNLYTEAKHFENAETQAFLTELEGYIQKHEQIEQDAYLDIFEEKIVNLEQTLKQPLIGLQMAHLRRQDKKALKDLKESYGKLDKERQNTVDKQIIETIHNGYQYLRLLQQTLVKKLMIISIIAILFLGGGLTLNAAMTKTVEFISPDGEVVELISGWRGRPIENGLPVLSMDEAVFEGWYLDPSYTVKYESAKIPNQNTTLYAKFIINHYVITYIYEQEIYQTVQVEFGQNIEYIEMNIIEGLEFKGWYLEDTFETIVSYETMPANNLTLYAKYGLITYDLTYMTDSPLGIITEAYTFEKTITLLIPEKEGHDFIGWFLDEALTNLFDETNMPAQDIVLYARYEIKTYTISFGNETFDTIEVLFLANIPNLPTPTKIDYFFDGWYIDEALTILFEYEKMPAMNLILYAYYIDASGAITINFITNGGSQLEAKNILIGQTIDLEIPTRGGYIFTNWYIDEPLTKHFDNQPNSNNISLYAGWVLAVYDFTIFNYSVIINDYFGNEQIINIPNFINMMPVKEIADDAFAYAGAIEISLADNVEIIGARAFTYNSNLEHFNISENSSLTTIKSYAFSFWYFEFNLHSKVQTLYLPKNVSHIESIDIRSSFFKGFIVDADNYYFTSQDGVLYNKAMTQLKYYPSGKTDKIYNVPSSVSSLGGRPFYFTFYLEELIFDANSAVHEFPNVLFEKMYALRKIVLPPHLVTYSDIVFGWDAIPNLEVIEIDGNNSNFVTIDNVLYDKSMSTLYLVAPKNTGNFTIPNSVKTIKDQAFYQSNLTNLTISENVHTIALESFKESKSLINVYVEPLNSFFADIDGVLMSKDLKTLIYFPAHRIGTYIVPKEIEVIADAAFYGTNLSIVRFEQDSLIKSIGYHSFSSTKLDQVYIPNTVITISQYAFATYPGLTIYVEAVNKPLGWHEDWAVDSNTIIWGYKGQIYG